MPSKCLVVGRRYSSLSIIWQQQGDVNCRNISYLCYQFTRIKRTKCARKQIYELLESYVVGGLAKCEACVILWHRQSELIKINRRIGGEAETKISDSHRQERATLKFQQKFYRRGEGGEGRVRKRSCKSAASFIICACIQRIRCIPLRTEI